MRPTPLVAPTVLLVREVDLDRGQRLVIQHLEAGRLGRRIVRISAHGPQMSVGLSSGPPPAVTISMEALSALIDALEEIEDGAG